MRRIEQQLSRKSNLVQSRIDKKKALQEQAKKQRNYIKRKNKKIFGRDIIEVPTYVDLLRGDQQSCHDFFNTLKDALNKKPLILYLSFKNTKAVKATCMLLIYSTIDIAREASGVYTKIAIIWSKSSKVVNAVINGSGKFLPALEREKMLGSAPTLPVLMGDNQRVNELSEMITDYILREHFPDAVPEKEWEISSAIQESVDNVGRHAYPSVTDHAEKKWWFCCDRIGDNLFLVIYDSGIGIPNSISKSNAVMLARVNYLYPDECAASTEETIDEISTLKKMKAFLNVQMLKKKLMDGQLIRAAMHIDVTSTEKTKHGQGSKSIKGLITNDENSFLLIFSNHGFYRYSKDIGDNETSVQNRKHCIQGTLIQWSI